MRLLLFSDLHLDAPFRWAPPEVARRRRRALRETLLAIVDLAIEERVDAVLSGGDLYEHERCSRDSEEFLRAAFERLGSIPAYLVPGNHDWYGPESLYRRVVWSANVHVFTADRLTPATLADGLTLWGAAHHAPAGAAGFLAEFRVDRGGTHLALFHGSERGFLAQQGTDKVPHAPFDADEIERAGLQHAFLGHYHRPRDAERHTYPGNPDPLTFGEDGERGAVIATVRPDGSVERLRRRVARSQVHDVLVDIADCRGMQEVRERVAAALDGLGGMARVTLAGEVDPDLHLSLAELDGAVPWMEAVVARLGSVRVRYDVEAIAAEPTVRGEFVRDVNAAELAEETRRRVLIAGLRALDGRSDLEVP